MSNLLTIAALELQRAFTTRRGLTVVVAFLCIWLLILRYAVFGASHWLTSGGNAMLRSVFSSRITDSLLSWQVTEFSVLWVIGLYFFPLLTLVLANDQTASDRARGTLRLLSLHTSRSSIFLGRFTGLLLVQALLLAFVLAATVALVVYRDASLLTPAVETAGMVFINFLCLIAAYTAAMAVISLFAKSARQATTWATILWIVISLLLSWLASRYPQTAALQWLMPGAHISSLLTQNSWDALRWTTVPLLQTFALLTGGWLIMRSRDL